MLDMLTKKSDKIIIINKVKISNIEDKTETNKN